MKYFKKSGTNNKDKHLKRSFGSRLRDKRFNSLHALLVIILFGVIGIAVLQLSHAATTSILDHADWTLAYPTADAHVANFNSSKGSTGNNWNQGSSTQLWVSDQYGTCKTTFRDCAVNYSNQTYLKFNVTGATGKTVRGAHIRLYVIDGSPDGGTLFRATSNNWAENTITWSNAPGNVPGAIGHDGKATTGQWVDFTIDLDSNPIKGDGTYSFVIANSSKDAAVYSSREGGNPPQLALVFDSPPIYNIPSSIVGQANCSTSMSDQTAAINSWLASVPNSAIARFGNGMCYRTEGSVALMNKKNVTVDGNGATLQAFTDGCDSRDPNPKSNTNPYDYCKYPSTQHLWPRNRYGFDIQSNKNVTIRNITVNGGAGAHPAYNAAVEAQSGFNMTNDNDGVLLDRVTVKQVRGDYVYIDGSQNVTIQNSNFTGGAGRQGFAMTAGTNVYFQKNTLSNPDRSMIDLEPYAAKLTLQNIHMENNTIVGTGGDGGFLSCAGADAIFDGIYFSHNTIKGAQFTANCTPATQPNPQDPSSYKRHNFQFVDNTSDTAGSTPHGAEARIKGIDGVLIQDNSFIGRKLGSMVIVQPYYSRNIKVINNKLLFGVQAGRYITSYETNSAGQHIPLENMNYCERGNQTGDALTAAQSPAVPVCK